MNSNAMKIKARGGIIIGVNHNNPVFDFFIKVPDVGDHNPVTQIISTSDKPGERHIQIDYRPRHIQNTDHIHCNTGNVFCYPGHKKYAVDV